MLLFSRLLLAVTAVVILGRVETANLRDVPGPPEMVRSSKSKKPSEVHVPSDLKRQSPVSLDECRVVSLPKLKWSGYSSSRSQGFAMRNNGETARITFPGEAPYLSGGRLTDRYLLHNIHLHWGTHDSGTEHAFQGKRYALEMHLVHYKAEYTSVLEALSHPDGLAVVGVLFEVSDKNNSALAALVSGLRRIQHPDTETTLAPNAMTFLGKYATMVDYFMYNGSLTTPPYSEVVLWHVRRKLDKIGVEQLAEFEKLIDSEDRHMENVRELQPINGRPVFCNAQLD